MREYTLIYMYIYIYIYMYEIPLDTQKRIFCVKQETGLAYIRMLTPLRDLKLQTHSTFLKFELFISTSKVQYTNYNNESLQIMKHRL